MEILQEYQAGVFSACAEVVPPFEGSSGAIAGILRVRGGSSEFLYASARQGLYSPRARR